VRSTPLGDRMCRGEYQIRLVIEQEVAAIRIVQYLHVLLLLLAWFIGPRLVSNTTARN
jgi:hypothetical protein